MREWLARLAFSFFVIAIVLGWETYRGLQRRTISESRAGLYLMAGGMSVAMGVMGMRERHKRQDIDRER